MFVVEGAVAIAGKKPARMFAIRAGEFSSIGSG
jgi:hypothetical protein